MNPRKVKLNDKSIVEVNRIKFQDTTFHLLVEAIIKAAADDYVEGKKLLNQHPEYAKYMERGTEKYNIPRNHYITLRDMEKSEEFFAGTWYTLMTDIPGDLMIDMLDKHLVA